MEKNGSQRGLLEKRNLHPKEMWVVQVEAACFAQDTIGSDKDRSENQKK